jgi:hypothetical protein
MNTRTVVARDLAKEAPHSLSERVARFAIAINGCAAQAVSKPYLEQAKRELTIKPAFVVVLADRPTAGTLLLSR